MYLKEEEEEKKIKGDGFPLWTGLFGVASVSLGNQDEMARHLYRRHEVESLGKACEAGHCTEGLHLVCLVKPL